MLGICLVSLAALGPSRMVRAASQRSQAIELLETIHPIQLGASVEVIADQLGKVVHKRRGVSVYSKPMEERLAGMRAAGTERWLIGSGKIVGHDLVFTKQRWGRDDPSFFNTVYGYYRLVLWEALGKPSLQHEPRWRPMRSLPPHAVRRGSDMLQVAWKSEKTGVTDALRMRVPPDGTRLQVELLRRANGIDNLLG